MTMKVRVLRVGSGTFVEAWDHPAFRYRSVRVDCEPKVANMSLRLMAAQERREADKKLASADQLEAMALELEKRTYGR